MKFTASAAAIAIFVASTSSSPLQTVVKRQPSGVASAPVTVPSGSFSTISSTDIKKAVLAWQSDTGDVSNFLNVAGDGSLSDDDLRVDAGLAFNSEVDELTHKTVLDTQICGNAAGCATTLCNSDGYSGETCSDDLQNANIVLVTQGTFQSVVDNLADMRDFGVAGFNFGDIDHINNGNDTVGGRCTSVLPAIDTYFRVASDFLIQQFGDGSLVGVTAVRPAACG